MLSCKYQVRHEGIWGFSIKRLNQHSHFDGHLEMKPTCANVCLSECR